MTYYILDDKGNPIAEKDVLVWGRWLETADRTVAKDNVGDVKISTVFLGLDYSWGDGPPLLYETMIFGGEHDQYLERYTTREEALKGHKVVLAWVKP